jgi:hypothetical protein
VEVAPGSGVAALRLGVACDGSVTLLWGDGGGVRAATLAGVAGAGACDGVPGPGPWSAPVELALAQAGAALPDLVVNDAGAALAVWQQGAAGQPSAVLAALRPAGADWGSAEAVSTPTGHATWNPKPGLDAAGNAAVGYLDGTSMVVSRRPSGGAWSAPEVVSGSQRAYYPALALAARGDLLVAWLAYDPANTGSVWQRLAPAGAGLGNATRLSGPTENADWPSAAFAGDGSVAVVGWVDDASNVARASVWSGATWARSALGGGWWGGQVSVGAGSAAAVAGWAMPNRANPNSAQIVGRAWQ